MYSDSILQHGLPFHNIPEVDPFPADLFPLLQLPDRSMIHGLYNRQELIWVLRKVTANKLLNSSRIPS